MALPSLFLSHGAPTPSPSRTRPSRARGRASARASRRARWSWPRRTGIRPSPTVTTAPRLATIHDFHGFPRPLYDIRYEPPGHAALAERVTTLLARGGFATEGDARRGHRSWRLGAPQVHVSGCERVPVVQLSIQSGRDAAHHLALGKALAPLRGEGVLVLASGGIVHNLPRTRLAGHRRPRDAVGEGLQRLGRGERRFRRRRALVDWLARAPEAAAPFTPDHFLPFFVALGAGGFPGQRIDFGFKDLGSLGMDAWRFGAA